MVAQDNAEELEAARERGRLEALEDLTRSTDHSRQTASGVFAVTVAAPEDDEKSIDETQVQYHKTKKRRDIVPFFLLLTGLVVKCYSMLRFTFRTWISIW